MQPATLIATHAVPQLPRRLLPAGELCGNRTRIRRYPVRFTRVPAREYTGAMDPRNAAVS